MNKKKLLKKIAVLFFMNGLFLSIASPSYADPFTDALNNATNWLKNSYNAIMSISTLITPVFQSLLQPVQTTGARALATAALPYCAIQASAASTAIAAQVIETRSPMTALAAQTVVANIPFTIIDAQDNNKAINPRSDQVLRDNVCLTTPSQILAAQYYLLTQVYSVPSISLPSTSQNNLSFANIGNSLNGIMSDQATMIAGQIANKTPFTFVINGSTPTFNLNGKSLQAICCDGLKQIAFSIDSSQNGIIQAINAIVTTLINIGPSIGQAIIAFQTGMDMAMIALKEAMILIEISFQLIFNAAETILPHPGS